MNAKVPLNEDGTKRCCTCKQNKSPSEFHKDKNGVAGVSVSCKVCATSRSRAHYARKMKEDPVFRKAKDEAYLKSRWGFGREEYNERLRMQGACAICGDTSPANWHLDHCHSTGQVREFLCANCNRGIGQFNDNEETLMKAIDYLRKHRELSSEGRRP